MSRHSEFSNELLEVAENAVRNTGAYLMKWFGTNPQLVGKMEASRSSISSEYDKASSDMLLEYLLKGFFNHNIDNQIVIISEEIGEPHIARQTGEISEWTISKLESEISSWKGFSWIIDPIDGSIPYARGVADFIISVSLLKGNKLLLGMVYDPVHDELFSAWIGKGAWLNGKAIKPSAVENIHEAYVSVEHKVFREVSGELCQELARKIRRMRVAGTCGLELCYVACGRLDALIKLNQPPYDYTGGALILSESLQGKKGFTALNGTSPLLDSLDLGKRISFLASNSRIHQDLSSLTEKWQLNNPN